MQMPWNDWHRTGTLQLRNLNNEPMAEIQIAARYRPALKIFFAGCPSRPALTLW